MTILDIIFRYIAVFAVTILLSGCLGGSIAQQIVRSIATSVADKTMARAMDVDEDQAYSNRKTDQSYAHAPSALTTPNAFLPQSYRPTLTQAQVNEQLTKRNLTHFNSVKRSLQETQPNPYQIAIGNTAFEEVKPIAEPLPQEMAGVENSTISPVVIQGTQLVRVELFNILIGEEKNTVYENARMIGATNLPQQREWPMWRVATGAIQSSHNQPDKKLITFLIPPEFGKLPSGAIAMVELASPGELNVARYKGN